MGVHCELCGTEPVTDIGLGTFLCAMHALDCSAWACRRCGARLLGSDQATRPMCSRCLAAQSIADMPPDLRAKLDTLIADEREMDAMQLLMAELKPRANLSEAEHLVSSRKRMLALPAPKPPDVEVLWAQLTVLEPKPVALEALWDGDTQGWFVVLQAILPLPSHEHGRYTAKDLTCFVDKGGDLRLFNGSVPPWPEARHGASIGQELACRLGVPFHFASPESPDDCAPRWWDLSP